MLLSPTQIFVSQAVHCLATAQDGRDKISFDIYAFVQLLSSFPKPDAALVQDLKAWPPEVRPSEYLPNRIPRDSSAYVT